MFTGIVQGIRKISLVSDIEGGRKLRIQLNDLSENLEHGASVAVNGVCLTAVKFSQGWVGNNTKNLEKYPGILV